jgi:hypothetical protein
MPVDPFTGKAYRYKPVADGFLLYSVGGDLEDDGGKHGWPEADWVWRGSMNR